jgi:hypothetical protein
MAVKFIGNCSHINWQELTDGLSIPDGYEKLYGSNSNQYIEGYDEVSALWKQAGYDKINSVKWTSFFPGVHFPVTFIEQFEQFTNTVCARAWVSCIEPGYSIPWHKDYEMDDDFLKKYGTPIRMLCHISAPKPGHIFILDDHCFYMEELGNIYEWSDWKDWHGGVNIGFEPKFLLNFVGRKKDV